MSSSAAAHGNGSVLKAAVPRVLAGAALIALTGVASAAGWVLSTVRTAEAVAVQARELEALKDQLQPLKESDARKDEQIKAITTSLERIERRLDRVLERLER